MVASIFAESAEAIRSKLGVEHGVLCVFVPQVVVVSQVLTLSTIPVTYLYMERISEWLGRIGRRP